MSAGAAAPVPDPDGREGEQTQRAGANGEPSAAPNDGSAAAAAESPPAAEPSPAEPSPAAEPSAAAETAARPRWSRSDPHADFLITSEQRDAAEARLRQAVADEVLDLDQFGDRMRAVLEARTRGDLDAATAGVPLAAEPRLRTSQRGTARPAAAQQHIVAIMSEHATRGRWRPAPETTAVAVMGSAVVDLQGAEFAGDELKINALACMGSVEIVVPEGVEVEVSGFAVMGDRSVKLSGDVLPGTPLVRVDGYALMGSVEVRNPKRKERLAPADGRGAFADRVPLAAPASDGLAAPRPRQMAGVRRLRRWAGGLLAAAAIALPLGWVGASDQVAPAVFGSTEHVVSAADLADGEETVGTLTAFGSVQIVVPEGVNVDRDGVTIFGSSECEACSAAAQADAPTVTVRSIGAFGSVEVVAAPGAGQG